MIAKRAAYSESGLSVMVSDDRPLSVPNSQCGVLLKRYDNYHNANDALLKCSGIAKMITRVPLSEHRALDVLWSAVSRPRLWIAQRFRSRRALGRMIVAWLKYQTGFFSSFSRVNWERVERIIFACQGNICRSPYAEHKARSLGLTAISCGLTANGTASADQKAVRVALERSIDLTNHVSCNLVDVSFSDTDLILVMQPEHVQLLDNVAMQSGAQVALLGLVGRGSRPYITDPYGADLIFFRKCFDWIDEAVGNTVIAKRANRRSAS